MIILIVMRSLHRARPSFLKKRSKRLLWRCRGSLRRDVQRSFLVLFFKKELLPFYANACWRHSVGNYLDHVMPQSASTHSGAGEGMPWQSQ
jgi:hypothetical protein